MENNKMYLTTAEAKAKGIGSVQEQLDRYNSALPARGKADYEADVRNRPTYHDGTPRKTWEQLGEVEQWSWNRPKAEVA
jgi:hypothetical protein